VNYIDGQKTGYFLDQKYNRRAVMQLARGRRVLDCFTHTGAFALHAARGGAAHVTAVDISQTAIDQAIAAVNDYRSREGVALYRDVTARVATIGALYDEVEALEGERIETVKARLLKNLDDLQQKPDPARFEQELIFYLEKYDINEEKVRLRQHCRYFMETIDGEPYPGKKLGFIIQEMGREINTTGSKANHAGIQKLVVRMKDELEKIREQSMNIL
jgi:uncharacterized protein (TIGR00255 family)